MRNHTPHIVSRSVATILDRRATRSERGGALVEFAIVIPLLLVLLFGILQLGLATYRLQGLHAASRDGARLGSYSSTTQSEIEMRVLASLDSTLLQQAPMITIEPNVTKPCATADEVVVTIAAESPYWIPFIGDETLSLNSRAEFLCEG